MATGRARSRKTAEADSRQTALAEGDGAAATEIVLPTLRAVLEGMPIACVMLDDRFEITYLNPAAEQLFGWTTDEARGKSPIGLMALEERRELIEHIFGRLGAGDSSPSGVLSENRTKDDRRLVCEWFNTPLLRPDRKLMAVVGLVQDVTERTRAEEALRKSEASLAKAQEIARLGNWELDLSNLDRPNSNALAWSDEVYRIFGFRPQQFPATNEAFFASVHPDDIPAINEAVARSLREGVPYRIEHRVLRPDGSERIVLEQSGLVRDSSGKILRMVGTVQDITERKQAEAAVKESEERFRATFEQAAVGIAHVAPDGGLLRVNTKLCEIVGYKRDELLARTLQEITYPADAASDRELVRLMLAGDLNTYSRERRVIHVTGKIVHINVTVSLASTGPDRSPYLILVVEDITGRKELEQRLRQSQKMEAVGRLAAGVSHDFNNLLTVISGYTDLMARELPESGPARQELDQLRKAGDRAAALTRQLLTFGRKVVLAPRVVHLGRVVSEMEGMLLRLLPEDVKLELETERELGRVKADEGQIEQVLMNLVLNARDAMPRGGTIRIRTSNIAMPLTGEGLDSSAGSHVLLAVSDTGRGMDRETQSHLFEPFFTTKAPGKGTGLGLAMVYGIVKQSGGQVVVHSELGHGTTIAAYFPHVDEPEAEVAPSSAPQVQASGGDETVLLAEDDEQVRELTQLVLTRYGYNVLQASQGEEALRICESHDGPIELMVTDVVMPQMSGPELARRLSRVRPAMKVLYLSGHTSRAINFHGLRVAGVEILQKPFRPEELARKVRELLDN